jgi:hypothetical protein
MLIMPYLAGAIGGLLVVRLVPKGPVDAAAIRGFCAGAGTGVVLGVLAAFAGGPLGDGRLSAVGPSAWQVTLVGALELGIAAAISAGVASWWYGGRFSASPGIAPADRTRTERTGSFSAVSDRDSGHVIFIDRWAADHEPPEPPDRPSRRRGPSALP